MIQIQEEDLQAKPCQKLALSRAPSQVATEREERCYFNSTEGMLREGD